MNILKTVAQNVLSGCVGGLLVMSAAQAQKTTNDQASLEVRTHKLVIVDEKNNQCGAFYAIGNQALFQLGTEKSFVQMMASDSTGCSFNIGMDGKRFIMLEVNDDQSGITVSSKNGAYGALLHTTENKSNFALIKSGTKDLVSASVDNDGSNVLTSGFRSGFFAADQRGYLKGILDWDSQDNTASISLANKTGVFYSQPMPSAKKAVRMQAKSQSKKGD